MFIRFCCLTVAFVPLAMVTIGDCLGGNDDGAGIPFHILVGSYDYTLAVDKQSVSGKIIVTDTDGLDGILVRGDVSDPEGAYKFEFLVKPDNGNIKIENADIPDEISVPRFREILFQLVFNHLLPQNVEALSNSKDGERFSLVRQGISFSKLSPVNVRREEGRVYLSYSAEGLRRVDVDSYPWRKVSRVISYEMNGDFPRLNSIELDYLSRSTHIFGDGHYRVQVTRNENVGD